MREATPLLTSEPRRALAYPISRWCWRPAAGWLAARLEATSIRPGHLTACNFLAAAGAAAIFMIRVDLGLVAAGLVLTAWFFDRADGLLARRQATASPRGAWLDANVDELTDVALHVAIAWVAAGQCQTDVPWLLLVAFLAGKYLLMYGLNTEEAYSSSGQRTDEIPATEHVGHVAGNRGEACEIANEPGGDAPRAMFGRRAVAGLWHLPGNADVRVHLTAAAMASGYLVAELALIAAYYNVRWIVRYALVARRLGGVQ